VSYNSSGPMSNKMGRLRSQESSTVLSPGSILPSPEERGRRGDFSLFYTSAHKIGRNTAHTGVIVPHGPRYTVSSKFVP